MKRWGKSPPGPWKHGFYAVNSIREQRRGGTHRSARPFRGGGWILRVTAGLDRWLLKQNPAYRPGRKRHTLAGVPFHSVKKSAVILRLPGPMPSPLGKLAERQPGRMRFGMQSSPVPLCQVHTNFKISPSLISHLLVPSKRQLPSGGSLGGCAALGDPSAPFARSE